MMERKGQSRKKAVIAGVFALGLVAGLLKVFVFSGDETKVATASAATAPAPATPPVLTLAKPVPAGTASLKPTGTKPPGGSPTSGSFR